MRTSTPIAVAADAASAVAYGFREVETTVPVLGDAPSNAVALLMRRAAFEKAGGYAPTMGIIGTAGARRQPACPSTATFRSR